jgi:hypothetical protein
MRRALVLLLVCACSSESTKLETHDVTVTALAGDAPDQGAVLIAHRANGEVIDATEADASGRGVLTVETNAFITTWFRWTPRLGADGIPEPEMRTFAVSTPAPDTEILIHGPVPELPVIGSLQVAIDEPIAAAGYLVSIGCLTRLVTTLPVSLDLTSRCLGTDSKVDVLVRALDGNHQYIGYAAGQAELVGAAAAFHASAWQFDAPPIRLILDGVDPIVRFAQVADGLEIDDDVVHAAGVAKDGSLWNPMATSNILVRGYLLSDGTTGAEIGMFVRSMNGLANEVTVSSSDFMRTPPAAAQLSIAGNASMSWGEQPPDVDLVYHSTQIGLLSWNVVVPPTAGSVTLPAEADIADRAEFTMTRNFESPLNGFGESIDSGLHFERASPSVNDVISPVVGDVRSTKATR